MVTGLGGGAAGVPSIKHMQIQDTVPHAIAEYLVVVRSDSKKQK